jgi:hypothetical protein
MMTLYELIMEMLMKGECKAIYSGKHRTLVNMLSTHNDADNMEYIHAKYRIRHAKYRIRHAKYRIRHAKNIIRHVQHATKNNTSRLQHQSQK